ncbi:MAG: hypothetical protein J1E98_11800 [Lachnospiraceae bacterium]|nr:hypothetical protein [Lachnospiraceae bacterium]
MIEVKLSIEEYNRLFMLYSDKENTLFCKIQNDHIIFACDRYSNDAIASISLNTPEGEILSNYTECQLRVSINHNEDIFVYETCMNPDDQYIGHCFHCYVNYCESSYSCRKDIYAKIKKLDKNINDIKFINPIPNRDYDFVKELYRYERVIEGLQEDFSDNADGDVKEICETAHLLQNQIKELYDKWKY